MSIIERTHISHRHNFLVLGLQRIEILMLSCNQSILVYCIENMEVYDMLSRGVTLIASLNWHLMDFTNNDNGYF